MAEPLRIDPTAEIISRYTQDAPVDVDAIARDLGLDISIDVMDPEIAGKIVRDQSGKSPAGYSVFINGRDPLRRQRFTLAHEIAHYVLHRDLIGDGLRVRPRIGEVASRTGEAS